MIPESFIRDLLDRVDIVEVVSRVVTLKKKGINWFGLCPFHHEKSGSFSVNQSKQFFKCFGCGAHGNAIGFLMQYKGISYPEAIRELAAEAGMQVPEERGERVKREKAASLTDLMGRAMQFYEAEFMRSEAARNYLRSRQITEETRKRFGLGYSPDGWQALEKLFGADYRDPRLESCGLVIAKDGKRYDRFRGRLMFPIRNPRGQVIGFGARIMGDGEPKYLNSPETEIFKKGHEVYGLWEGREAVRKAGRAIVCEGYMDVIQLSQAGYGEAVAALGTAIGEAHVKKLFKIVPKIIFSFDGDSAGRHAARRALEVTLPVITDKEEARFVLLPPEHDPDSLIKAEGPQAYEREIEKSFRLSDFFIESLREGKELGAAEGRAQFLAEAKPLLLSMKEAPVLRMQIIQALSLVVRMETPDICGLVGIQPPAAALPARSRTQQGYYGGGFRPRPGAPSSARSARRGAVPIADIRERMLRLFLAWPELFEEFRPEIEEYLVGSSLPGDRRILEVWRACSGGDPDDSEEASRPPVTSGTVFSLLEGSEDIDFYRRLIEADMEIPTSVGLARHELHVAFLKIALENVRARMNEAASADPFDELLYNGLSKRSVEIQSALNDARRGEIKPV